MSELMTKIEHITAVTLSGRSTGPVTSACRREVGERDGDYQMAISFQGLDHYQISVT